MAGNIERELIDELAEVRRQLQDILTVLDQHNEAEAAYCVCGAIERLIGAPTTIEQWFLLTGRDSQGNPLN